MQEGLKKLLRGMGGLIVGNDLAGIGNDAVAAFEGQLAILASCKYAITTTSGTLALSLALEATRIGPGHEVIVPALSAFGTLAAIVRRGATAVVADIDPARLTLCPTATKAALTSKTRAIIPVHAMGIAPDVPALRAVVEGAFILEDAAQGFPGALLGDAAAVSFATGKGIDLGEGGAVLTDDEHLGERIRRCTCLGHSGVRIDGRAVDITSGIHESFGTSARMPALSAALGMYRIANLKARWQPLRDKLTSITEAALSRGLQILGPPRIPLAACFQVDSAADREFLEEYGYSMERSQVYPAHTEPVAMFHPNVRILATPAADALGQELLTLDLTRDAGQVQEL